ncbi:MAG: protein phosphatase 2C domain-containing protein [Lachnospiraceae bacterium]|nr:protein phosphatase 2C domain-containing protein [Lachnospiraceae bacterium]
MEIQMCYQSAIGGKERNEDSLLIEKAKTIAGDVVFAVVCDGMGGIAKGELASAEVIRACDAWFCSSFPNLLKSGFSADKLYAEWNSLIQQENKKLVEYGEDNGIELGTTITALLLMEDYYYIVNVGDSRVYSVTEFDISILTRDHTLVMREAELGMLTYEEMEKDSRGRILLQCIGASGSVEPDFFEGYLEQPVTFFLCSDGCRHLVTNEEFYQMLNPQSVYSEEQLDENIGRIVQENLNRGEMDNISAIALKIG